MVSIHSDTTRANSPDEGSRLLPGDELGEDLKASKGKMTPIPKVQLSVLCSIRIVEPIIFSQIFPYINTYMEDLHVTDDPKRIGFYSGLVESSFAIAQLFSIFNFARLSDRIGRRPVIISGIMGIGITTMLFGLSKSLAVMLFVRILAGLCSGNAPVMHSVMGELTDATNQAVALPLYGLVWPIGCIIGPLIGGLLEHPATKFPGIFGYDFLRNNPYFLPCFLCGALACLAAIFGMFFLEETLPSKRRAKVEEPRSLNSSACSTATSYGTIDNSEDEHSIEETPEEFKPLSIKSLISDPVIRALCGSGFALSFLASGFDVLFVLYCYTSIQNGGLSLPASQIGYSFSGSGIVSIGIQLLVLPYLLRTFDKARLYNFCTIMYPCVFVVLSTLNSIARSGFDEATGVMDSRTTALVWVGIAIVLAMARVGGLAYSISMILTKESAPNPQSLGSANGLVQFSMCLARAASPAFSSSIFAYSIDHNVMGGYLWVLVIVLIGLGGVYQSTSIARATRKP